MYDCCHVPSPWFWTSSNGDGPSHPTPPFECTHERSHGPWEHHRPWDHRSPPEGHGKRHFGPVGYDCPTSRFRRPWFELCRHFAQECPARCDSGPQGPKGHEFGSYYARQFPLGPKCMRHSHHHFYGHPYTHGPFSHPYFSPPLPGHCGRVMDFGSFAQGFENIIQDTAAPSISDRHGTYHVTMDTRPFSQSEVRVSVEGDWVTVRGQHREEAGTTGQPAQASVEFLRRYQLPRDADPATVTSHFRQRSLIIQWQARGERPQDGQQVQQSGSEDGGDQMDQGTGPDQRGAETRESSEC